MSKHAYAYYRTSSAANVGVDKDSEQRQRLACQNYAQSQGLTIDQEFYDAAVSGADPIEARPGFAALLAAIAGNGARTILVETANRFARDLIVQETGYRMLHGQGIELIAVDAPASFVDETPTAVLIRQLMGSIAQFEKAMIVAKLKGARSRRKALTGKCEGRKNLNETNTELVAMARSLRVSRPSASLRDIALALASAGFVGSTGRPYHASVIADLLRRDLAHPQA